MNARADRFFLLDSLRGVGALLVLAVHATWFASAARPTGWFPSLALRFEAVVSMFFMISGFLLYRPFVKARLLGGPPPRAVAYGWRRMLRVVPAFWVALTVIALTVGPGIPNVGQALRNFGFLQLYYGGGIHDVIPQAWTLSVEAVFYICLPAWAWMMRRAPARDFDHGVRQELLAIGTVIAGSIAYIAILSFTHAVHPLTFPPVPALSSTLGYMDQLGLGMVLAVVSLWVDKRWDGQPRLALGFLARRPGLCWAVAGGVAVFGAEVLGFSYRYTPAEFVLRHAVNTTIALAVMIPAVFGDPRQGLVRRVLGTPVLLYFGMISYGFYLYHWTVLHQMFKWQLAGTIHLNSYFAWYGAGLVGALACGTLSYYLVERPALSLKRLVPPRPSQRRDEALAEPAPATPVTVPRPS